ncbi:Fic family protein [Subtercola endophyticus]|uniref:Fic family protein n=1 Tax=Subtercola endophyticus TaxID=2895559 RepID=UPI001E563683|nr:Fic family protein [Subtercola endophyticus]UFS60168.1 Fic family protein [Subtercola endophyticus]
MRRQTGSYESISTPTIADWVPMLGNAVIADVIEASSVLAAFDEYALARLGAENPALGPMSAILLRTESASSSQIEQLTASAKQLALAELDEGGKANATTVVANVRAMEAAIRLSDHIDEQSILEMHRQLLSRQPGWEHEAGRFREELVWIGNRDTAGPIGAAFIAPQHGLVPGAIADVLTFARRDDIPVLVQIAVAHAQFETIHPFVDGNGRTGRALAQAMLRNKGLVTHTTVPLSAGLLVDTEGYFGALAEYRAGDAGPIVRRFTDAARFASVTGKKLVDDLDVELERSRIKMTRVRSQSAAWLVLPRLVGQPVVNAQYLKKTLGLSTVTALRAIDALVEHGVLVERTGQARNRVWQHPGILSVLDGYADGIRRATAPKGVSA